jgi:hypothetical protein
MRPVADGSHGHHRRSTCRACGGRELRPVLDLGPSPLANAFLARAEQFRAEVFYPLVLYFCETCSLVQLLDVIDPEILFRNYVYVTGTSDTMAAHFAGYAGAVVEALGLGRADLVVEAGSNDGSLLKGFKRRGVRTLGVEPAGNIAALANAAGIETVEEFFGYEAALHLRAAYGPARAVIGNNVLAHVDDPRGFLAGARALLSPDGCVIVEVPYLVELLNRLEYDTIYHEHLCYFSVTALSRLFASAGLSLVRVDRVPVHGGSLRAWGVPALEATTTPASVTSLLNQERAAGLLAAARYGQFAADVAAHRRALTGLLAGLMREGVSIAGYGAPAKATTLLNYCGIDAGDLPYTVDKSPLKCGLSMPGTHIPVLSVDTLLERQPAYVLILAWNFADEIMRQQSAYRGRGGRFIIPLPEPVVAG